MILLVTIKQNNPEVVLKLRKEGAVKEKYKETSQYKTLYELIKIDLLFHKFYQNQKLSILKFRLLS